MQHFQASLETEARISFQASHLDANAAVLQNASQRADSIAWASYFCAHLGSTAMVSAVLS